ncbi:MAG: M28 family peptidase [Elusimicrobia bacterium]|nr:M28 family peptidase [Elusimicrobiota bacterium]
MRRSRSVLLVLLAIGVPAASLAQTLSAPVSGRMNAPAAGAPAVGAIPAGFIDSLGIHLDQTAARLQAALPGGGAPSISERSALEPTAAAVLPASSLGAPGLPERPTAPGERRTPAPGADAAEYLARAALAAPAGAAAPALEAQAAAALARALADPEARETLAAALRDLADARGRALADRLEALSAAAEGDPYLRQLAGDLAAGPLGQGALFDGNAPAPSLSTPEEFAAYAARRFMAGRLLPGGRAAVAYPQSVPDDKELYDEVARSPLTNPEREKVVVELFRQAGARPEEIRLQDTGEGTHNIFVVKKGRTDRTVVIGAHHDKVDVGHGTIDNWTGSAMVPNLYQALRGVETEDTLVFAVFSREEEGLIGSGKFVRQLSPQERARIDAMLNLDTLAVDGTYSWKNNSDKPLLERIKAVASQAALALKEVVFWGGDADSSSFRNAGIQAITVFGASEDVIWDTIHGPNDTIAAFSIKHYRNTYDLMLAMLKSLDSSPIGRVGRLAMRLTDFLLKTFRSP